MSELVLVERFFIFSFCLVATLVLGAIHGFLLGKGSKFAILIPLFFMSLSIGLMLTQGWARYSAAFTAEDSPYAIIGSIVGSVSGEVIGWKIGLSTS